MRKKRFANLTILPWKLSFHLFPLNKRENLCLLTDLVFIALLVFVEAGWMSKDVFQHNDLSEVEVNEILWTCWTGTSKIWPPWPPCLMTSMSLLKYWTLIIPFQFTWSQYDFLEPISKVLSTIFIVESSIFVFGFQMILRKLKASFFAVWFLAEFEVLRVLSPSEIKIQLWCRSGIRSSFHKTNFDFWNYLLN